MVKELALEASSIEDAAKGLLAAAMAAGHHGLSAMPWNRFEAAASTWWLVPSTENPAYKYGKIILTRRNVQPKLLIGLYMEKGIGLGARELYRDTARGRRYVMDRDWTWHAFIEALGLGVFDSVMTEGELAAGRPLTVAIDASNVPVPTGDGEDVHSPSLPRDVAMFEWSSGQLEWRGGESRTGILQGLGRPNTMRELANRVQALENLDWAWVNFHAGLRFRLGDADPACELWSDERIWQRVCRPWRRWIH